jgi:hypothetical protein
MKEDIQNPQINISKIRVGGGIMGAIFTVSCMSIFLIGLPVLWYIFPAAIALGGGIALAFHFVRHESPGAPWILNGAKK